MTVRIGFGHGIITPPLPVQLAGFGDRHDPATSVHDDLEARAVYVAAQRRELRKQVVGVDAAPRERKQHGPVDGDARSGRGAVDQSLGCQQLERRLAEQAARRSKARRL